MAFAPARILLLDYTCVQPFGHNVPSLRIFGAYLSEFAPITILVPATFRGNIAEFEKRLASPLQGFFRFDRSVTFAGCRVSTENFHRAAIKITNRLARRFTGREIAEVDALRNVAELDRALDFSSSDILLLPSADMYGVRCLVDYFEKCPPERRPRLHFRLIGVMEHHSYSYGSPLEEIVASVRRGRDKGLHIQVSCETPAYLDLLQGRIADAFLFPYPMHPVSPAPEEWELPTIALPGQGRVDKGYNRISNIATLVKGLGRDVRWLVHSMRATDRHYSPKYQDLLHLNPSIEVMSADLRDDEMRDLYRRSSFSILPYSRETYKLRGSAVFQEALAYGHLCVVPKGTGIAGIAEVVGNGIAAETDEEFARAVVALCDLPWQQRRDKVAAAQERYGLLVSEALARIFA
ncbi:glycosyltransferase [Rhizobium nepotum]|uniref:glycosyltransferase n=1 Tax=Rhizobium nepotum TaxID=1035271 RepID=UPI003CF25660